MAHALDPGFSRQLGSKTIRLTVESFPWSASGMFATNRFFILYTELPLSFLRVPHYEELGQLARDRLFFGFPEYSGGALLRCKACTRLYKGRLKTLGRLVMALDL